MSTKLVDSINLEQKKIEDDYKKSWIAFLQGEVITQFEEAFQKVQNLLKEDNWVVMNDGFVYDHKIRACWYGLVKYKSSDKYIYFDSGVEVEHVLLEVKKKYNIEQCIDIPTKSELTKSLTKLNSAPFSISNGRPAITEYFIYKKRIKFKGMILTQGI